ncbi:MAG: class I SAM-dependent methyltransferase [Candidatus Bathyarchaeota archaeon]|nr:class I SAM-dependent methyltransferase [Candidatus Bathyarchaeota archaeon]
MQYTSEENVTLHNQALSEQIHKANIEVHRSEAKYYEAIHPEVYSKKEQKRLTAQLNAIDKMVTHNQKKALDVGAGTGNLTGKLLAMGYHVTATDISPEMCAILKKKYAAFMPDKLVVINSPIEALTFQEGEFDLITSYSVLHHLPDYEAALVALCGYLKKGGVIYIDHEASPYYWATEKGMLASIIKGFTFHSNPMLNSLYFGIVGLRIPMIDYTLSDYWFKKEHALNHTVIAEVFRRQRFEHYQRTDHYLTGTWLPNPLAYIYRLVCKPEMSFWVAKK